MNIVLYGFKCSGKSTVGVRAARQLNKTFVDIDEVIEALYYNPAAGRPVGLSCREIANEHGEPFFRALERDAVKKIRLIKEGIIATGGGAVLDFHNHEELRKNGLFVYLKAKKEALRQRILDLELTPSILQGPDRNAAFEKMYADRLPIYEGIADIVVDTDGLTPKQVTQQVCDVVQECTKTGINTDMKHA